jgi:DNA-binding protein H-NS
MRQTDFASMSTDELWKLYEELVTVLAAKMDAEKRALEERLRQLTQQIKTEPLGQRTRRRPYPKVLPKFRNPRQPSETWSGRGKQPRWLTAQLRSGKHIEDFRIGHAA